MFSCEYCKIFKNTYFEKTTASVHSVSKLQKWEMENIRLHKSNDLVRGIFKGSPSEVVKKILVLNIFSNSTKMYLIKFATIWNVLKHLWMTSPGGSDDKILFSIITDPLNPIGCSFEKMRSLKSISYKEKELIICNEVKITV